MNFKTVALILVLSFLFLSADAGGQEATDERDALNTLQQSLLARIDVLSSEQNFLLFQKEMYASDSKYLLLNVTAKTGQLKYKNRVLKNFRFLMSGNVSVKKVRNGMLVLAKKLEGKNGRNALIFGDSLILQWKNTTIFPLEKNIPVFSLTKPDMLSVFYAVETGARAYVIR